MIAHDELVSKLVKPGDEILSEITGRECHVLHMIMGICGEAGELLDALKKSIIYRKPLDLDNVIEELGDIEFYLEGLRQAMLIKRDETLTANINKLSKRYETLKYSNQQAIDRADKQ